MFSGTEDEDAKREMQLAKSLIKEKAKTRLSAKEKAIVKVATIIDETKKIKEEKTNDNIIVSDAPKYMPEPKFKQLIFEKTGDIFRTHALSSGVPGQEYLQ
jgi:hypothetical protein